MSLIMQTHAPDEWAEFQATAEDLQRRFRFRELGQLRDDVIRREAEILSSLEAESAAIVEENLTAAHGSLERISALGLSPEGGSMASATTMQTMRASGTFDLPEDFKRHLPLILGFILIVFVLLKK